MTDNIHALVAAYALDALEARESAAFEGHLGSCDSCVEELRGMHETTAAMASSVAQAPPEPLRSRVLLLATTIRQVDSDAAAEVVDLSLARSRRSGVNRVLVGVAAAAVLAVGVLGVSTYQANQRANDAVLAAEQITAVFAEDEAVLRRTEVSGGGKATLAVLPANGDAAFLASSLPDLGPDKAYQLWAIGQEGATSVGLLEPKSGRAAQLVELPVDAIAFAMSVEPAGGSPAPSTEPVLVISLES